MKKLAVINKRIVYHDTYIIRILVALDELGAAIFGFPNDVTISSWCGKWKEKKRLAALGYILLDEIQIHHCEGAIIHDEERAEDAEHYLTED